MVAPSQSDDRITKLRIKDFRSLADVTLDLSGLSVLIGDNGSGKSSLIEAIETVRYFSEPGANAPNYFRDHPRPVRGNLGVMTLGVTIESPNKEQYPPLFYEFGLAYGNGGLVAIDSERLDVGPIGGAQTPLHAIRRTQAEAMVFDQVTGALVPLEIESTRLLMSALGGAPRQVSEPRVEQRAINRVAAALRQIEVHAPFDSLSAWAARRTGRRVGIREAAILQPTHKLDLLAGNLSNVYHSLKNDHSAAHWAETMEHVRLGLGDDIDDVSLSADASGGQHALSVRYRSNPSPVPAAALSDGTLGYLAFVALLRLPSERTLLAFDEPELHLHPALLVRVVSMFEKIGRSRPVVLATHSDRLLDTLLEPAKSVVLCELDDQRATRLLRPDPAMLAEWLTDFRGMGDIRATGLQSAVMEVREPEE